MSQVTKDTLNYNIDTVITTVQSNKNIILIAVTFFGFPLTALIGA